MNHTEFTPYHYVGSETTHEIRIHKDLQERVHIFGEQHIAFHEKGPKQSTLREHMDSVQTLVPQREYIKQFVKSFDTIERAQFLNQSGEAIAYEAEEGDDIRSKLDSKLVLNKCRGKIDGQTVLYLSHELRIEGTEYTNVLQKFAETIEV